VWWICCIFLTLSYLWGGDPIVTAEAVLDHGPMCNPRCKCSYSNLLESLTNCKRVDGRSVCSCWGRIRQVSKNDVLTSVLAGQRTSPYEVMVRCFRFHTTCLAENGISDFHQDQMSIECHFVTLSSPFLGYRRSELLWMLKVNQRLKSHLLNLICWILMILFHRSVCVFRWMSLIWKSFWTVGKTTEWEFWCLTRANSRA